MITLAFGDIHFPYHRPEFFDFIRDIVHNYQPDEIICMGDEVDFYNVSRFDKDAEADSFKSEYIKALDCLRCLYKIVPNAYVCTSNHTMRVFKRANQSGILSSMMKDYRNLLEAPDGWVWGKAWKCDGVEYRHGEGPYGSVNPYKSAVMKRMHSVVMGHYHTSMGVHYHRKKDGEMIFGAVAGCFALRPEESFAMSYGENSPNGIQNGCCIVVDGKQVIHEHLDPPKLEVSQNISL